MTYNEVFEKITINNCYKRKNWRKDIMFITKCTKLNGEHILRMIYKYDQPTLYIPTTEDMEATDWVPVKPYWVPVKPYWVTGVEEMEQNADKRKTDLLNRLESGLSISGIDLSNLDLRDIDLSYEDLTDANLSRSNLTNNNLTGANFTNANL